MKTTPPFERVPLGAEMRIVQAVGRTRDDLDLAGLRADLENVASLHWSGVNIRNAPAKQKKCSQEIVDTAGQLKALIGENVLLRKHIGAINGLISEVQRLQKLPQRVADVLGVDADSAFRNTILHLSRMYKTHFKLEAGYTKDSYDDEIKGEFIDFAEAALKELNIGPYARSSIARELTALNG